MGVISSARFAVQRTPSARPPMGPGRYNCETATMSSGKVGFHTFEQLTHAWVQLERRGVSPRDKFIGGHVLGFQNSRSD